MRSLPPSSGTSRPFAVRRFALAGRGAVPAFGCVAGRGAFMAFACAAGLAVAGFGAFGLGCAPESSRETALGGAGGAREDVSRAAQAIEAAPPWADTGGMSVARHGLTATALLDGRVLIVGGQRTGAVDTGDVFYETAEIWSGIPGAFQVVGAKMSTKRAYHVAVRLADGKVLAAAGYAGDGSADVFDPASGTWASSTLVHQHGTGAAAVLLVDGRALLVGGQDPGGAVEVYDPATQAWTDRAPLLVPRRGHTATVLNDGRVLVAGGTTFDDPALPTAAVEVYDPKTDKWQMRAPMAVARTLHGAARIVAGDVLVAGGVNDVVPETDSVEIYDTSKNQWHGAMSLTSARALHTTTLLENGAVLVTGGIDETGSVLRSAELYDPDAAKWVAAGQMHHGRLSHAVAAIAGGGALAAGGEDQSTAETYRAADHGQPCEVGRQCASGFCVDGVCCNTSCNGSCVTCALPGAEGDCSLAAAGTDPHHDCGPGGPCDNVCAADGTCTDRVGEVCVEAACSEDGLHAVIEATCKQAGGACDPVTIDCTPFRCGSEADLATPGCLAKCRSIDDCTAGYACDPAGRCRLRPDVASVDPDGCSAGAGGPASAGGAAWIAAIVLAFTRRRRARGGKPR